MSDEAAPTQQSGTSRLAITLVAIAAAGLSLTMIQSVSDIVGPVFLSLNLLITTYPIFLILRRKGVPAGIASVAAGAAVFVILGVMLWAMSWSISAMVNELSANASKFQALYSDTLDWLGKLGFDSSSLVGQLKSISPASILSVAGSILNNASWVAGVIITIATALIFMVMDQSSMEERLAIIRDSHPRVARSFRSFVVGVRSYWLVTTVFGLIVAVLDGFALWALGVSLPITWAIVAFITNYIPNIGFVIGVIPPALIALVENGPWTALWVIVIYSVLNFVIQSIIQPRVTGDAVGLTATMSFISLLLWAWVLGAIGALVALPATLLVKCLLIDPDPKARWVNAIIASNPDTARDEIEELEAEDAAATQDDAANPQTDDIVLVIIEDERPAADNAVSEQ